MNKPLEKDVLQYGLLIGIAYQFYQSLLSLFPTPAVVQSLTNIFLVIILIFLYVVSQKRKHVQLIAFLLHVAAISGFSYFWFHFGGLAGTVPSFLCLYVSFMVITSHGYFLAVGLFMVTAFVVTFVFFPGAIGMESFYEPGKIGKTQGAIDYVVMAGVIVIFTVYIKRKFIFYRDSSAKRYQQLAQIANTLVVQNQELTKGREETRAINENLEMIVGVRTRDVENQSKALAEFAFINAHMLRGPLCRIIGLIQLMEKYPDQYPQADLTRLKDVAEKIDQKIREINNVVS